MVTETTNEIEFKKYVQCGAYHWQLASWNPLKGNAFVRARYDECVRLLRHEAGGLDGLRVLDVGCGDGVLTWKLHQAGARAYGADLSDIAIRFARQQHAHHKSDAEFFVASCYDLPFPNGYFDAVISSEVIEHVQDPRKLLSEVSRVLKPGGVAVISTPVRFTERPMDKMHVIEWFPSEFQALVCAVFPSVSLVFSHPLVWSELIRRSRLAQIIVNMVSLFHNPFDERRWKNYSIQYAIARKSEMGNAGMASAQ